MGFMMNRWNSLGLARLEWEIRQILHPMAVRNFGAFVVEDDLVDEQNLDSMLRRFNSHHENNTSMVSRLSQLPTVRIDHTIQFKQPQLKSRELYFDNLIKKEVTRSILTTAPPRLRNREELANAKMVKQFSNRYELLWIMVTSEHHPARKDFTALYEEDRQQNTYHKLENLLTPETSKRLYIFPQEGMFVKLVCDYASYESALMDEIKELEGNEKILEIYFEEDNSRGLQAIKKTTKKLKNERNLSEFLEKVVKVEIEKQRKDMAYSNFIHFESGPELFNRRNIIQECLFSKSQEELRANHVEFMKLLAKESNQMYGREMSKLRAEEAILSVQKYEQTLNRINRKRQTMQEKREEFDYRMTKYLVECYPIEDLPDAKKKEIYDWVISQYAIESPIYPVVNNTFRFSLNAEKFKPISTFVRYLYEALRFYFTNRYREINYRKVYRGSRISFIEQNSFKPGRYLWNLGFMSTSVDRKTAVSFLPDKNKKEGVLIQIELSSQAQNLEYLWDQEGFYMLERINEIKQFLPADEKQVLFNPLNVFEVISWEQNEDQKVLKLKHSPQVDILQKKKFSIQLTDNEKKLIQSIQKLKNRNYDKGVELLEHGKPAEAITYYNKSEETGEKLSFTQKGVYIESLKELGEVERMEQMLQESIAEQERAVKQLEQSGQSNPAELDFSLENSASSTRIADSIELVKLCHETNNLEKADQLAERTVLLAVTRSEAEKSLTQETIMLEVKGYIQLASIKHSVNQTLDSFTESIKSLQILDELPRVHLCEQLIEMGRQLKKMKELNITEKQPYLRKIMEENKIFSQDVERLQDKTIRKLKDIRSSWNSSIRESGLSKSDAKSGHKQTEQKLKEYFQQKDRRDEERELDEAFAMAYWEIVRVDLSQKGLSEQEVIRKREKLKKFKEDFYQIKDDYKKALEKEREIYEIIYRNIYKTSSINVERCLRSYKDNLFGRYEAIMRQQEKYEGDSVELARVLWKQGEIMQEYGNIVQTGPDAERNSLQEEGLNRIRQAREIFKKFEASEAGKTGTGTSYIYESLQIESSFQKLWKSKIFEKEEARKLAMTRASVSSSNSLNSEQRYNLFANLLNSLKHKKQLYESDKNFNQTLYGVQQSCNKIQVLNESISIKVSNESYMERLRACYPEFQSVVKVMEKYKQREVVERNGNLSQLYLLMAENQFRLGLIINASQFLARSKESLMKSLKLDKPNARSRLDKDKLLYGNKTKINLIKLQSHIISFFGTKKQKVKLIDELKMADALISEKMNEPLSEAEVKESIGLLVSKIVIRYQQMKFQDVITSIEESIQIRTNLLGPHNKYNARLYTFLMEICCMPQFQKTHGHRVDEFYQRAHQIYNYIDFELDPMLVLYSMQLETGYLIIKKKQKEACERFDRGLMEYESSENKQLSVEVAKEYMRAANIMLGEKQYRKKGLVWMQRGYKDILMMEGYIKKHYDDEFVDQYRLSRYDKKSLDLEQTKKRALDAMIIYEGKVGNKEKKKMYEQERERLNKKEPEGLATEHKA